MWNNTRKYLLLSGYLTYRLTDRYVDSIGCQVGYLPFDYKRKQWAKSSDWKWQAVPLDKTWLPELIPPAQPLGEITPIGRGGHRYPDRLAADRRGRR